MKHYLYIIYSKTIDTYYVGESPDANNRLMLHNKHHFKKNFTKAASDWEMVLKYECKSREDALYLEYFIKRMKSRKLILKVIDKTSILNDLLNKK